jgi:hypothetical protein
MKLGPILADDFIKHQRQHAISHLQRRKTWDGGCVLLKVTNMCLLQARVWCALPFAYSDKAKKKKKKI